MHAGAHTQFKEHLRQDLHKRLVTTTKQRAGPSFDERIDAAVKKMQASARVIETESRKNLTTAIEKGRARPVSAVHRKRCDDPDPDKMLRERRKKMKEDEAAYADKLDEIKDKMACREPLFRLSEVNAAFAMQRERARQRRQEMADDEHKRWEHMRELEGSAAKRPLLIEDPTYKAPPKNKDPPVDEFGNKLTWGRESYDIDKRISRAISAPSFLKSDWHETVSQIKERADNRVKLHEEKYPGKGDMSFALSRARMMHGLAAQVPKVI